MCELTLFGAPALQCNGRPREVRRRKAMALLAYLAVTRQAHSRETLVALLWPEYGQSEGRADLSRILSTLRNSLGSTYFLADRQTVALDERANLWVDVVRFRERLDACRKSVPEVAEDECRRQLDEAAALYEADFLAGFTLPGCPAFDEWQLLESEALRRDLAWILDRLVHLAGERNDLAQGIAHAQRRVSLDPLHEPAQRQLIELYLRNGQRAEAHRQYQVCVRVLQEELGVEPQPETKQLYEKIRQYRRGKLQSAPFLVDALEGSTTPPTFVMREKELSRLQAHLDDALRANGGVVFITGGAGRGKTSLMQAFVRRAQNIHQDLIVAGGSGSAFAGIGDPYLPFREVLSLLSGDITTRHIGEQMSAEQARRLWALLPLTVQAIVERGPQLLDVFISGSQLLARAETVALPEADWLQALQNEVSRRQAAGNLLQPALLGQFTNVLHHLAHTQPLLITLDDLQWIDEASAALLFHLGRRLQGSRILIVGAYRPNEASHPLVQIVDEFRRTYGDLIIDLAQSDQDAGRAFVDAYLDTELNRLDEAFRQALFQRTAGHPLFTVELLREMQSRGDLVQDSAGRWIQGRDLDWDALPARVEAVIARRIEHLDADSRAILAVASIEGQLFTAEVAARVLNKEEGPLLHALSQQLAKRHRLALEQGETEVGGRFLSRYQFAHVLFQQYLHRSLDPGERRRLHGAVALALAQLYAAEPERVVVQLAHHYSAAGQWDKAIPHLVWAGDVARDKASLLDAATHYQTALTRWPTSDRDGRASTLRKLGECQWMLGQHAQAVQRLHAAYDLFRASGNKQGAGATQRLLGRVYWESGEPRLANQSYQQALAILEGEAGSAELGWALAGMSAYHMLVGNYDRSIRLGERALALARQLGVDSLAVQCLCDLGSALCGKGDWSGLNMEQESLELALTLNRPHDAGRAYVYIAEGLIYLGRYEEARAMLHEAQAYTQRTHLTYVGAGVARYQIELDWRAGNWSAALVRMLPAPQDGTVGQGTDLAQRYRGLNLGRAYNDLGQAELAYEQLMKALAGSVSSLDPRLALLGELARAETARGRPAQALGAVKEILEWVDDVRYLYPNVDMAFLFLCRLPLKMQTSETLGYGRAAVRQLWRLDAQYHTPATAVCRLEGEAWVALAEGAAGQAAALFDQALEKWQQLAHPYDQARALSGLSRACDSAGDSVTAHAARTEAMELVSILAAKLHDPGLKTSFINSPLVREIRRGAYGIHT